MNFSYIYIYIFQDNACQTLQKFLVTGNTTVDS